ncbi:MAG: hypothetical protein JF609_02800 [Verrucomicrobia bacterium]|nr:hypothetical protein [Verrucomicrobiota bacterium]
MSHTWEIVLDVFWLAIIIFGGGWILIRTLRGSDEPVKNVFKLIATVLLVLGEFFFARSMTRHLDEGGMAENAPLATVIVGSILACGYILAILWAPSISGVFFSPITNLFDGGNERPEDKPFYSIAHTKRKRGQYHDAIMEVRKQQERFPYDFEGVMLLASIRAENLNDLQGADNVLNQWCEWPKAPDQQVAVAWTTMADWHLKYGVDVDAARASLQKIVERYPETELALKAQHRLAHLVDTERKLMKQHDALPVPVPEGVKNLGLRDSSAFLQPKEIEPGQLAAAHVKHLQAHPHDSEVREKLAVIYAKDFRRLDLATMELLQLINEKRHSAKQISGWLNTLANYQVELGADIETVRTTLETIVERFPDMPIADITRRRLGRLNSEFKGKEKTPGVELGVYEQNIGLKYGAPPPPGSTS